MMTKSDRDPEADPGTEGVTPTGEEAFGSWLRRQRELREISLREIADSSKISLRYLEALEEERFDLLPAQIFAKGFLRQYARYVGIDPEETVNFFLMASRPPEQAPEVVEVASRPRRRSAAGWPYLAAALGIAVILFLVFWGVKRLNDDARGEPAAPRAPSDAAPGAGQSSGMAARAGSSTPEPATGEPPGDEVGGNDPVGDQAARRGTAIDSAATMDASTPPPTAPLVVTVDFHRDCWVEAAADGARKLAEIRVQGESLRLEATELVELKVGDAGAVEVEVNGRPLPLDARQGVVETLRIDLETAQGLEGPGVG